MREYRAQRKRIKIDFDPKLEISEPMPIVKKNVMENSLAPVFDDAKHEWTLNDVTDSSDDNFSERCELCNTNHLKHNFIIYNPLTGKSLRVGSRCILRFGLVSGNVDVSSGVVMLQNFADEKYYVDQLQTMVGSVMVLEPYAKDVHFFYKTLKALFDLRGIKNPSLHQIGDVCYGMNWGEKSRDMFVAGRLKKLWDSPGMIEVRRERVKRDRVYKEGTTMGHKKRTTVYLTAVGRSEFFKVDKHIERKNDDK